MSEQLKPCPFCGRRGELRWSEVSRLPYVTCPGMSEGDTESKDCRATVKVVGQTPESALAAWNRRADA